MVKILLVAMFFSFVHPLSINSVINCAKTHPKKVISTPGQSTEEDIAADDM